MPMTSESSQRPHLRNGVIVLLLVGFTLGCFWRFTSWHERFGFHTLLGWGKILQGHPWTPLGVILVFILGGLLFFVHVVLLWVTVFTFDPFHAFLYCELGSLASALVVYGLGRVLRQDVVARIAGSYTGEVSHALARRGILSLILLHIFPICPFSVLNLLSGATHIRFKDFVVGTICGVTPGLLLICFLGSRLVNIVQRPQWFDVILFTGYVTVGLLIFRKMRARLQAGT
jgi:phospholipase D1/2